jgi:hypothetical protein
LIIIYVLIFIGNAALIAMANCYESCVTKWKKFIELKFSIVTTLKYYE